jgi:solute carrier family 12 sodium/potassium/chloride transporter 2
VSYVYIFPSKTNKHISDAKMRVFTISKSSDDAVVAKERADMAALLRAFRINASAIVLANVTTTPLDMDEFETTALKMGVDAELIAMRRHKTQRQLRAHEFLMQYSQQASLIVVTMPVPRADCPPALYMCWYVVVP